MSEVEKLIKLLMERDEATRIEARKREDTLLKICLLYTSPSPRD